MTTQWERQRSALKRLESRYGTDIGTPDRPLVLLHTTDAVNDVCCALEHPDTARRPVTEQDIADALLQVEEARSSLEFRISYEHLQLLDHLRVAGWSWERIAEHLGMRSKQHAHGQWTRLREKCPSYRPLSEGAPWFGQLLHWRRRDGEWGTSYLGRLHRVGKVDRAYADALGGGTRPGWHFAQHPDSSAPHQGPGPGLGRKLDTAKRMAEVWIVTDEADRQGPWDDAPDLVTLMGGGGAGFGPATVRTLVGYPDHENRRITVHGDSPRPFQRGEQLGTITPTFTIPGTTPAGTGGEPIRITWTPQIGDTELPACESWREAARAFGAALAR